MTTNSAGLRGAKPTMMLTTPDRCRPASWSPIALDEESLIRGCALKCPLAEQAHHERADVHADLRPQRLVVRLEDHPLGPAIEGLFEEQRHAADRNVSPIRIAGVVEACDGARAPDQISGWHTPQAIHCQGIQYAVLLVGENDFKIEYAIEGGLSARRRLPHAARRIGGRIHSGNHSRGADVAQDSVVVDLHPWVVDRAVDVAVPERTTEDSARSELFDKHVDAPFGRRVENQKCTTALAIAGCSGRITSHSLAGDSISGNHHQVEEIHSVKRPEAGTTKLDPV